MPEPQRDASHEQHKVLTIRGKSYCNSACVFCVEKFTAYHPVAPKADETRSLILEITCDGDRLIAQGFAQLPHNRLGDLTGLPKFELFAEGEKNFFAKVADNQIAFETGPDGRATSLIMHRAGREMPAAARLS